MSNTCVFCKIGKGTAPAAIVREWPDAIAFLPQFDRRSRKRGCTQGHILVIPKAHVADFTEDDLVSAVTMARASQLCRDLREATGEAYNVISSAGEDATQTVFHLHLHLVPRRKGDGLKLPWS